MEFSRNSLMTELKVSDLDERIGLFSPIDLGFQVAIWTLCKDFQKAYG